MLHNIHSDIFRAYADAFSVATLQTPPRWREAEAGESARTLRAARRRERGSGGGLLGWIARLLGTQNAAPSLSGCG